MPLRVMQIYVPQDHDASIDELLEGIEILGRWRASDTHQTIVHLIAPAEETESIMDRFEQRFADAKGFHVVLFPVEAVLPRPGPPEKENQEQEQDPDEPEQPKEKERISREELYHEVSESLGVSRVFLSMTILSAIVAAVGLLRDDVAVIIGAMVIAPLLGPNVALSLGTTLGDLDLVRRAIQTNLAGVGAAFVFSVTVGFLFTVDAGVPAIVSRTEVGPGDLLLALAAGSAGTLAFTRGLSGAVIGVMVAVALMPPLVVCGMLLSQGQFALSFGAFLLTGANVISVNLAGVATFLAQGVRPRRWWEAERAKKATVRATAIWVGLLILLVVVLWLNQRGTP